MEQASGATKSGVVKHGALLQANFGHVDSDDNLAFKPFVGNIPSIVVFICVASVLFTESLSENHGVAFCATSSFTKFGIRLAAILPKVSLLQMEQLTELLVRSTVSAKLYRGNTALWPRSFPAMVSHLQYPVRGG